MRRTSTGCPRYCERRWRRVRERVTKYGPKSPLSPTIGDPCSLCGEPFRAGDFTTQLRTTRSSRHGDTPKEVHWDCAQYKTAT
jgi:hypothetical protein